MFITADLTQAVIPEDKRKYISPVSRSSIFFASHAFPRVPSLASPFPYYRAFPRIPFSMFCTGRWASAQDDTSHLRATYARLTRDLRQSGSSHHRLAGAFSEPSWSNLGGSCHILYFKRKAYQCEACVPASPLPRGALGRWAGPGCRHPQKKA